MPDKSRQIFEYITQHVSGMGAGERAAPLYLCSHAVNEKPMMIRGDENIPICFADTTPVSAL